MLLHVKLAPVAYFVLKVAWAAGIPRTTNQREMQSPVYPKVAYGPMPKMHQNAPKPRPVNLGQVCTRLKPGRHHVPASYR